MKTVLYLGTDPSQFSRENPDVRLIHYPVIKIVPRSVEHPDLIQAYSTLDTFTHVIFTSKNAVKVFFNHLEELNQVLKYQTLIAIGRVTADHLCLLGHAPQLVAENETQEGVVELLRTIPLSASTHFFLPRSSLSRPVLVNFLVQRGVRFHACDLYETVTQGLEPMPNLDSVDEIVFTSPTTVKAFLEIFGGVPKGKKLVAIGPVTEEALLIAPFLN